MTGAERELTTRKETDSPEAYDAFLKGWQHYQRRTPDDFRKAVSFFDEAVKLDPDYSRAYAALAATYWTAFQRGWTIAISGIFEACVSAGVSFYSPGCVREGAENYLKQAMEVPTPLAHQVSADMLVQDWRHDEAVAQAQSALALDESDPDSQVRMAIVLTYAGRASEAVPYARRAMRLDPNYPAFYDFVLGVAYYGTGNAKDALAQFEKASERNPLDSAVGYFVASAYVETGESEKARQILEQVREFVNRPVLSVRRIMRDFPFRDAVVAQRFGSSLITAGACCEGEVEEMIDRLREQGKMK